MADNCFEREVNGGRIVPKRRVKQPVVELSFIQIQCVPVPNTMSTQCNVLLYGLTAEGKVFFKRDSDDRWHPEAMKMASSVAASEA